MRKEIITICNHYSKQGSDKYQSGKLRLNHYNYAKDIIRAADYSKILIEATPVESFCKEAVKITLEQGEKVYLNQYEDIEGFRICTIRYICKDTFR